MKNNNLAFLVTTACIAIIAGLMWIILREEPNDHITIDTNAPLDVATAPPLKGNATPNSREIQSASLRTGLPSNEELLAQSFEDMKKHEANWNLAPARSPWSSAAEQKLADLVKSPAMEDVRFRPTGVLTRCKATLCRLEASFPPSSPSSEWSTRVLLGMGSDFGASTIVQVPGEEGEMLQVIYAYR